MLSGSLLGLRYARRTGVSTTVLMRRIGDGYAAMNDRGHDLGIWFGEMVFTPERKPR